MSKATRMGERPLQITILREDGTASRVTVSAQLSAGGLARKWSKKESASRLETLEGQVNNHLHNNLYQILGKLLLQLFYKRMLTIIDILGPYV